LSLLQKIKNVKDIQVNVNVNVDIMQEKLIKIEN